MKITALIAAVLLSTISTSAVAATMDAVEVGSIHTGGDAASNPEGTEFYASGNDDNFSEFGVATFQFSLADFGGSLTDINTATFNLTINDRFFADGDMLEVFFSADDFDSDYTGLLYDASLINGINASQFASLISLGTYSIPVTDGDDGAGNPPGGTIVPLDLVLGAAEADLITEITNGSEFQLIIGVTDATHDITFSGIGNTFDPGAPQLVLNAIPEPTSALLVLLGVTFAGVARTRSRLG